MPFILCMKSAFLISALFLPCVALAALKPAALRTEWLNDPQGLDAARPRLSWRVEEGDATVRGQRQTAYRVIVASSADALAKGTGDLWDSGKVASEETLNVEYAGSALGTSAQAFWQVRVWDKDGVESAWSPAARWSMGVLKPEDWKAAWISFKDESPLHTDRKTLSLPPTHHFVKRFTLRAEVKRAVLHGTALGLAEWHLNSERVGDSYFEPGWADYRERLHYRTHDVTKLVQKGPNALGAIVADGWYAGYLGYALLVGYGPEHSGRNIYGKTPALFGQLEVEYADGTRETVATDTTWEVSGDGPIREADFLMGESFDARRRVPFTKPVAADSDWKWEHAIAAEANGSVKAKFFQPGSQKEVELGFVTPKKLVAYAAPAIRITEELPAKKMTEPAPGTYIFDLGENIAGIIRLKVRGAAGQKVQIRYGEMLHKDGRLMTENLRKARATDFYTMRGDSGGETWQPRFTYHGFQFVELTGLTEKPTLDAVTGLVLNNDTPMVGDFACSDEVMTRFWKNTVRTQKANFVEIPTDCPQRDERLGWMGDAQIYVRTASYNADVAAFFTKWVDDVCEAQRPSGAYPDYAPYPYAHGAPGATHGTAWTDAGIIVPYTMWKVYGDTRLVAKHWDSMVKFMDWRAKADPELKGVSIGNTWGDWLNLGEATPIEFIDLCYHFISARDMAEMARASKMEDAALKYSMCCTALATSFARQFIKADGSLSVETQSAAVIAISSGILDVLQVREQKPFIAPVVQGLVARIAKNDFRMATGFLGTKPLLAVLTENGQHDLAARLFQSRKFPSWGYEVEQGATSVWERWDSFTKEKGFDGATGKNNAAMNSFSHYSFGAVMQWAFQSLAGIDTAEPGFQRLIIAPHVPSADSNPDGKPMDWVRASTVHPRGKITSAWKREGDRITYDITIPANTSALVCLPDGGTVSEDGKPLPEAWRRKSAQPGTQCFDVAAGSYRFVWSK